MAHKCDISGVSQQNGNRVSHAKNHTKHVFRANLQERRVFIPEENRFIRLKLTTRMIRTIDRLGITKVLKKYGLKLADLQ